VRKGTAVFFVALAIGLLMAIAGFLLSAPIGSPTNPTISNPRMEFAPAIFVLGVIVTFTSAILYEIVKD